MTMLISEDCLGADPIEEERLSFPCSSSQLRCWFVNAVSPGNPALNVALRWELKGSLDRSTIEQAFNLIVRRHEMLRTRIVDRDGTPSQEVLPCSTLTLSEIDLTYIAPADRTAQAIDRARAEARRPFDLTEAPLLRVALLRLAPDHGILLVTIHQIAFDGWSIRLLSKEFAAIAAALAGGRVAVLPDLPMQFGDYAAWQKAYLDSGTFETERTYWRGRLAGAPFFEVPADRERPLRPTSNCEIVATHVPHDVSEGMLRFVKERHLTLFSFGCGVIATALHQHTGAEDISVGTQVSGRDDPDLDPIIGVFINNLVLRFDMSGDAPFIERLDTVNKTVQDALVHQRMPFHTLVELLKPPRDPRRMPLISVNFTVLQDVMDDARCGTFDLVGQPSLSAGSLYDLNFFLVHWPATGWRMALEYNTDLFEAATATQLLDLWAAILRTALETPGFRVSELRLPRRGLASSGSGHAESAIEAALLRHPAVAQTAVAARDRPDGTKALRAFVAPKRNYAGTLGGIPSLLMAYVGDVLPGLGPLEDVSLLMSLPVMADGQPDRSVLAALWHEATPSRLPGVVGPPSSLPAGGVAATLTALWTELLGVPTVEPSADFFELGGHSLLAMRMLARAEAAFGQKLRLSDLLSAPTIEGFATCIAARPSGGGGSAPADAPVGRASVSAALPGPSPHDPAPEDWRITEVRRPGADTTIFGIDSVKELHEFWEETGGDRGLFSVQLFEPGRPPAFGDQSFEEIASSYLALIRRVQPKGPYRLFGLCVHGVLAYEVAQQMRRAGDDVELLVFKSAWHPTYSQRLSPLNRWIVRLSHVRDNVGLVLVGKKGFAAFLANYSIVQKSGILSLAVKLGVLRQVPPRTGSEFNDEALLALMAARDAYDPEPYDGRVIQYVGPDAPRGRGFDPALGWSGVITGPMTIRDMETGPDRSWQLEHQQPAAVAEPVLRRTIASQTSTR